jgi:hypothetical protein
MAKPKSTIVVVPQGSFNNPSTINGSAPPITRTINNTQNVPLGKAMKNPMTLRNPRTIKPI